MAASEFPFFQSPPPTLRHLPLVHEPKRIDAEGRPAPPRPPRNVDRSQHGAALMGRIDEIEREVGDEPALIEGEPSGRVGLPLEIHTAWGHTLGAEHAHALTTNAEIEVLLAVPERDESGQERTRLVLHVPYGKLHVLREKFRRFSEESTPKGKTPNPWVANLEEIARAAVAGLWTDEEALPDDAERRWWEFWLHDKGDNLEVFRFLSERFGIELKRGVLKFLDRRVLIGRATRGQLEEAVPLLDCLAELRRARTLHLEWTDLSAAEQQEMVDHIGDRLEPPGEDAPSVALLDTGVNRGHPLLENLLRPEDNHTIFGDGDASDCCSGDGHGTLSAGLATYGDLREVLANSEAIQLRHALEGVRMIDEVRPHEPENYGKVTQQAVHTVETQRHDRKRVFAMPISSEGANDGRPSSWSAAVDALAFGSEEEGEPKRLIFLSAGNTDYLNAQEPLIYPDANHGRDH
ncbi:MAG: S8 family serine peptidase [Verrucomicrobiales bacterium]